MRASKVRSCTRALRPRALAAPATAGRGVRTRGLAAAAEPSLDYATRANYRYAAATTSLADKGIKLVVCDMAGTTVEENGLVYRVLRESMVKHGLTVSEEEMHPWHGAAKGEVIRNFIERQQDCSDEQQRAAVEGLTPAMIDHAFEETIKDAYAQKGAVSHISKNFAAWVDELHAAQIQIGLNTGYPQDIQMRLIDGLGLDRIVDHWISAYQVAAGRPAPYMVHRLMEQSGIHDVARVAKVGDTVNDIEEGKNAGCGLVVGVLSGADGEAALHRAGADLIIPDITHLRI